MIEEIKKLRRKGLSFRKIATELDTTIGKVQYQWTKYKKNEEQEVEDKDMTIVRIKEENKSTIKKRSVRTRFWNKRKLIPTEHLTAWLISKNKLFIFWKLLEV